MVALSRKSTYVQTAHRANAICKTTILDVTRRLLQTNNIMVSSYAQKKKKKKESHVMRNKCVAVEFFCLKNKISHTLISSPNR